MKYINQNHNYYCKTVISEKKESNSVSKIKAPDYLIRSIESTSVISIDSKDYLSLKYDLQKESLFEVDDLTISNTIFWIDRLRQTVEYYEMWWDEPLVNVSTECEIAFEWWNNSKKLTVYISQEGLEYVKVWGKDIDNDMEEGELTSLEDIKILWEWIS